LHPTARSFPPFGVAVSQRLKSAANEG